MPIFNADQLRKVGAMIFKAAGVPKNDAERVSDSLVKGNLTGHDSHGIIRIPSYLKAIKDGRIKLGVNVEVVKETPATALIDGNWGFGQLTAEKAMRIAIEKAKISSVSCVGVFHCNHIGRLGEWAMMAADEGMIGMVFNGYWGFAGIVAPYGGAARRFGTNPLAVSLPAGEMKPFLLDFATSIVAEGKVRVKRFNKETVPTGWILDSEGHSSNDPKDLYQGGMLLPFGRHKGYALSVLIDILCGPLVIPASEQQGIGMFILVINISNFTSLAAFKERVDTRFKEIKATPLIPGFKEVLIPGEPEFNTKEKKLNEGIFISDQIWQSILQEAQDLELCIDEIIG